jgi:hypothetical protein
MMLADDEELIYPRDRHVVDVMDAAGGAEEQVIQCLRYLYNECGLQPSTKRGPRHFSWFKTVVADHFWQKREQEFVINPAGQSNEENRHRTGLSEADFGRNISRRSSHCCRLATTSVLTCGQPALPQEILASHEHHHTDIIPYSSADADAFS